MVTAVYAILGAGYSACALLAGAWAVSRCRPAWRQWWDHGSAR